MPCRIPPPPHSLGEFIFYWSWYSLMQYSFSYWYHLYTNKYTTILSAKHEQRSDVRHSKLGHVSPLLFLSPNYSIQHPIAVFQSHRSEPNTSCSKIVWTKSRFTGYKQHHACLFLFSLLLPFLLFLPILSLPLGVLFLNTPSVIETSPTPSSLAGNSPPLFQYFPRLFLSSYYLPFTRSLCSLCSCLSRLA